MKHEIQRHYLMAIELGIFYLDGDDIIYRENFVEERFSPDKSGNPVRKRILINKKLVTISMEYMMWFLHNHEYIDENEGLQFKNGLVSDFRIKNLIKKKYSSFRINRIDNEKLNTVLKQLKQGKTYKEIGNELNMNPVLVYNIGQNIAYATKARKKFGNMTRCNITEDQLDKIFDGYDRGMKITDVMKYAGVSHLTAKKYLLWYDDFKQKKEAKTAKAK